MFSFDYKIRVRKWVLLLLIMSCLLAGYLGFGNLSLPNDKLIHFVVFFILTTLFYWTIEVPNRKLLRIIVLVICVVIAGIGSEFIQSVVNPMRMFDSGDIFCNEAGSIFALIISDFCNKRMGRLRRGSRLTRFNAEYELQYDNYETTEDGTNSSSSAYEYDDDADLGLDGPSTPEPTSDDQDPQ